MSQNQLSSHLLRLPAELRNAVYTYVIAADNDECWELHEIGYKSYPRNRTFCAVSGPERIVQCLKQQRRAEQHLALSLVCRQIYRETRLLPLSSHVFNFNSTRLFRFVKGLKAEQRGAVRRIKIEFVLNRVKRRHERFLGLESLSDVEKEFRGAIRALCRLERIDIVFMYPSISISLQQGRRHMRNVLTKAREQVKDIVRQESRKSVCVCSPEDYWETLPEASMRVGWMRKAY